MEPNEIKNVPVKDLKMEEGAEELMDSDLMRSYFRAAEALMGNKDQQSAMAASPSYLWKNATSGGSPPRSSGRPPTLTICAWK